PSMLHPGSLFFLSIPSPTTHIYTLSLHDALPIYAHLRSVLSQRIHDQPKQQALRIRSLLGHWQHKLKVEATQDPSGKVAAQPITDRKSTRLNSSHGSISYAVFCLKKKKKNKSTIQ